jgi:hypothetical protein
MDVQPVQVTQHELEEIFNLERDVAPKLKRIDELKSNVKALLIHKMSVQLGRFDAVLVKRIMRPVPWRQAVVDYLGLKFAEQFKKRFPVRMFCEVKVEEHAILPLWNQRNDERAGTEGTASE